MQKLVAIKHILLICKQLQYMLHWQIVARVTLVSLFEDARIDEKLRDEISGMIADQTLYNYEDRVKNLR